MPMMRLRTNLTLDPSYAGRTCTGCADVDVRHRTWRFLVDVHHPNRFRISLKLLSAIWKLVCVALELLVFLLKFLLFSWFEFIPAFLEHDVIQLALFVLCLRKNIENILV